MKFRCLRNCFINGQIYLKGEEHELPDSMRKSEKHFQPLGEPAPAPVPEPSEKPSEPKPLAEGQGFGNYLCPKCKVTHRTGSKIHKRHLKLLKG